MKEVELLKCCGEMLTKLGRWEEALVVLKESMKILRGLIDGRKDKQE